MTPREWKAVNRIFTKATSLAPSERHAYLDQACRNSNALRREVESLLAHHDRSGPFLGVYSSIGDKILSHYKVLEFIGEGGMGVVYKARDTRLDRVVAIKALPPWAMGDPRSRKRLFHEARRTSALSHPNIVTIHEIGKHKGVDFIVMEYVAGNMLSHLIPSRGLSVQAALALAVQVGDALAAAHAAGILHGDLKPSNIVVTSSHHVKLLDFGVARRRGKGAPKQEFGTKEYMAPEQHDGKLDARSEIFSFGLILYEMLCGKHAFGTGPGVNRKRLASAIRTKAPNPLRPKVPVVLAQIILRCLQKNPTNRFQSMRELLAALNQRSGTGMTSHGSPEPNADQMAEPAHRQLRSHIRRINYQSYADSRRAFTAIARLLKKSDSAALRQTVTSAMRDLIVNAPDAANGVPFSMREIRKLALDLIKLSKRGDLRTCFEEGDLQHLDLYGMNFAGEKLTGVNFSGSFLVEADFRESNLAQASFAGAYLRNANFSKANLSKADLTDADWFNALGFTQDQLARLRRDRLMDCPATVADMHRYLEAHYGFAFESWSEHVREQLQAAWNDYLRPGGLRDALARRRHK